MKYRDQRILLQINELLNNNSDEVIKFSRNFALEHSIYLELEILLAIKFLKRYKHNGVDSGKYKILSIPVGKLGIFNEDLKRVEIFIPRPPTEYYYTYEKHVVSSIFITIYHSIDDPYPPDKEEFILNIKINLSIGEVRMSSIFIYI